MAKYELLPPLTTDEQDALRKIIAAEGVRDPITVDEGGNILDGHHRHRFDKKKTAKRRVVRGLSEAGKKAYVFQCNFARRNLTAAQSDECLAAMEEVAEALNEEKQTQVQIATALGVNHGTVSGWLSPIVRAHNRRKKKKKTKHDGRVKLTADQKRQIISDAKKGVAVKQIAADMGVGVNRIYTILKAAKDLEDEQAARDAATPPGKIGIESGDFQVVAAKHIKKNTIDLILTDPPYERESVPLYGALAQLGKRVLKPGGWCLAYSGQISLPEVFAEMSQHLTYGWTFACVHAGGDVQIRNLHLHNGWKPIVGFYKPPLRPWWTWFSDVVSGGREKDKHEWQQAEPEAADLIQHLTGKKGMVCDPMCGSGTTLAAAKSLGRRWIGIEIDEDTADRARRRLA